MSEIKNNKNVDPNFEGKGGVWVKRNLTIVFSDPENLYGHSRLSLSITGEFRTFVLSHCQPVAIL